MLNAAVIGVGSMGKNHARVYSSLENVNLVAVADTNKKLAETIARKYDTKAYTDYKEMLIKEKIDVASITVPTKQHKGVALDVINKKIHVLVEKPIAPTVEEAKEIMNQAKKNNVKLMIGHVERFNPAIIELKKHLANKELGKIYKINIRRIGPFPPRVRDVGIVVDLGVHDLDIIRYLTNSEVKRIYAEKEQKIHTQYEDLFTALLKLENNTLVVMSVNWLTPVKIREISITGEKGMFKADTLRGDLYFFENTKERIKANVKKFEIKKEEPLKAELKSFVDCVINNKEPLITGEDGLEALKLALKVNESSERNEVIKL